MALLTLPDGRDLEYALHGPDTGRWVIQHHGTPGAAVPLPLAVAAAGAHGLGTVLYARPGYGRSTPLPGRRVADAAADVAALADHLGAERFVTAGHSGGGPHALATAAALGERCAGVACLAGVAPHDAAGLDWLAGMGALNLEEFGAAVAGREVLEAYLAAEAAGLDGADGPAVLADLASLLPEVDVAAAGAFAVDYLVASFRDAVSAGIAGWRDDDLAFVSPWGFDPVSLVGRPVTLWFGDADLMVPAAHGAWLAHAVPGADVHRLPGEGHLSLLAHADAVLAWLADLL